MDYKGVIIEESLECGQSSAESRFHVFVQMRKQPPLAVKRGAFYFKPTSLARAPHFVLCKKQFC